MKLKSDGVVIFGYEENSQEITFFAKDTGTGIDAALLHEMFDRFRQEELNDARKKGETELGLSISKKLVALLGAKMWAESKKGKGASFFFTLPAKNTKRC